MAERVSQEDMLLAAEWLDSYDGGEDGREETEACARVATWLREEVEARRLRAMARSLSAERGRKVGVGDVRDALARQRGQREES